MTQQTYPASKTVDQVDNYHGVAVRDPYRWLENHASEETAAWIAAQNALTAEYLSRIPVRDTLRRRFQELLRYPRHYDIVRRGHYLIYKRNSGLQKQLVVYYQEGLGGTPVVLIDPTRLSPDGTTRVVVVVPSKDGRYVGYSISHGGTDWEEYHIKDMSTREDLADTVQWAKLSTIGWCGDGFYYSRYPAPSAMGLAFVARNDHHQVWYHRVGTQQSADILVYEDQKHPLRQHIIQTTEDERFAILHIFDSGEGKAGRALWLVALRQGRYDLIPLITSFDDDYRVVDSDGDGLLVLTNRNAPHWRLVRIDLSRTGEQCWEEVIPEGRYVLEHAISAGEKLFVTYGMDAASHLQVFDRLGRMENEIPLPSIGTVQVFPGQRKDTDVFWSFASFTVPTTIYRYDMATRISSLFQEPKVAFRADQYEAKRVFYSSKDGTRIPMFIVHRSGLNRDGDNTSLLEAYGGNGMSMRPSFDPLLIALLERGVVYALPCLRGGGEYGESWHRAGSRENKQNVFDDCIAAAEWLQANGYTRPERSALLGVSNGGLLVGAVMTQRPDLFKVVIPSGGVMDMLRFQHFTLAPAWTAEYGCSDDPTLFPTLLAYSPLHNIKHGGSYPATLVTTSRHDDRVVPAHSFKFVATLQKEGASPNPYLIRIETTGGHGPVSLPQLLDERADIYAFMLAHTTGGAPPGLTTDDGGHAVSAGSP